MRRALALSVVFAMLLSAAPASGRTIAVQQPASPEAAGAVRSLSFGAEDVTYFHGGPITASPAFDTDLTLFMGGASLNARSGLTVSSDGGRTWAQRATGSLPVVTSGVAVSPAFATDRTLFAGTASGVYKSTDGGGVFSRLTGLPSMAIRCVAVSPAYAVDRTVFAGSVSGGLWRTTNGGTTWTKVSVDTPGSSMGADFFAVAMSPDYASDRTVFAYSNDFGMHRSTNGGATWELLWEHWRHGDVWTIAFSPDYTADGTILAGREGGSGGVLLSTDRGNGWTSRNSGLPERDPGLSVQVWQLAISPAWSRDRTAYAATARGLYVSRDGCASWSPVEVTNPRSASPGWDCQGVAWPTPAVVGTVFDYYGAAVSQDRGGSWLAANDGLGMDTVTSVSFSPGFAADRTVFAATPLGLSRSTDGGTTWRNADSRLGWQTAPVVALSPDFANDRVVIGGGLSPYGSGYGVVRSADGGHTWANVSPTLPSGFGPFGSASALAFSPDFRRDRTVWMGHLGAQNSLTGTCLGVLKSADGGSTWTEVQYTAGAGGSWNSDRSAHTIHDIGVSPEYASDRTVAIATASRLWVTTDAGATWAMRTPNSANVRTVAFSPDYARDRTIFVGTGTGIGYDRVRWTTDGGVNWYDSSGLPGSPVKDVAVSPGFATDRTVWASVAGSGLYISTDGGATFRAVSNAAASTDIVEVAVSPAFTTDAKVLLGTKGRGITRPGAAPPAAAALPRAPSVTAPAAGETGLGLQPTVRWQSIVMSPAVDGYAVAVYDYANRALASASTTSTEWQVPAGRLSMNRAYHLSVQAHNAAGWGAISSRSFVVGSLPPTAPAPAPLAPADGVVGLSFQPTFEWSPLVAEYGVDGYMVSVYDRTGQLQFYGQSEGTSWQCYPGRLLQGRRYSWSVRAHNAAGWGPESTWRTFIPGQPPAAPPSAPVLNWPADGADEQPARPQVSWRPSPEAECIDSYRVEVFDSSGARVASALTGTPGWRCDVDLRDGAYTWVAFAHNHAGWSPASETRVLWVGEAPPPAAIGPTLLSPYDLRMNVPVNMPLTFEWLPLPAAYEVDSYYVGVYDLSDNLVASASTTGNRVSIPANTLTYGEGYYWAVAARNASGWGDWSHTWMFSTAFTPPRASGPSLGFPGADQVTEDSTPEFSWGGLDELYQVEGWRIEVYDEGGRRVASADLPEQTRSWTPAAGVLQVGQWYSWAVWARNTVGLGYSSEFRWVGIAPPTPPYAPSLASPGNDVVDIGLTPTFDWFDSFGATKYRLYVFDSSGRDVIQLDTTDTQYTVPAGKLANGAWYGWEVYAYNGGGWSYPGTVRYFRAGSLPGRPGQPWPMAPADRTVQSTLKPTLSWTEVRTGPPDGYYIRVWDEAGQLVAEGVSAGTSWQVPAGRLGRGKRYHWDVHAYNSGGYSDDTPQRSFLTAATAQASAQAAAGFSLDVRGGSQTAAPGGAGVSWDLTVTPSGGLSGPVDLSVQGLPIGCTAAFTRDPVSPGGTTRLTVTAGAGAAEGVYPLTVTGVSGAAFGATPLLLQVSRAGGTSFSLAAGPARRVSVAGGPAASFGVTVTPSGGFASSVSLSVRGLPSGVTANVTPATLAGGGTAGVSVAAASWTAPGRYDLEVVARSGGVSKTARVMLDISETGGPDLVLSCADPTATVVRGLTTEYIVSAASLGGMRDPIRLEVRGLPSGVTATLSEPSVFGDRSVRLTVAASANASEGVSRLMVVGTAGRVTRALPLSLAVVRGVMAPRRLTIAASRATVAYRGSLTVSGVLTEGTSTVTGSTGVSLWRSTDGLAWTRVGTATWNATTRKYTATASAIERSVRLQLRAAGGGRNLPAMSAIVTVKAAPYLSAPSVPSLVRRGVAFTSAGYLKPRHSGTTRVYIQRLVNRRWVAAGYVAARNANYSSYTRYSASVRLRYAGRWRLRAYHSDADHLPTYGPWREVVVR